MHLNDDVAENVVYASKRAAQAVAHLLEIDGSSTDLHNAAKAVDLLEQALADARDLHRWLT